MHKISVIILTKNEENNILDCLETLMDMDEIIVVDDYSVDRTTQIIKNLRNKNIKLFKNHLKGDFSKQREFALGKATNEWVLCVDADERVSRQLLEEINAKIKEDSPNGFFIKRVDVLWGKRLMHGETGNVRLLRLAKKNMGKWQGKVHEVWDIKGKIGKLDNELIHYPHQTIREFLKEINYYSTIRAGELCKKNMKVSFYDIVLYPKAKFILNYFIRLGFLDGMPGLVAALMMSFHSFLVRGKLWVRNK